MLFGRYAGNDKLMISDIKFMLSRLRFRLGVLRFGRLASIQLSLGIAPDSAAVFNLNHLASSCACEGFPH